MGLHTPRMDTNQLRSYLQEPLLLELTWMLRAATQWFVQFQLKLGVAGYEVQVFSMDSTFLHARTLLEFLTKCTTNNYYGCNAYGVAPLLSARYEGPWEYHLHSALMHAQDRTKKELLSSFDGLSLKPLHEMPVDFAREVVRLWREFSDQLERHVDPATGQLGELARQGLDVAIAQASNIPVSIPAVADAMERRKGTSIPQLAW